MKICANLLYIARTGWTTIKLGRLSTTFIAIIILFSNAAGPEPKPIDALSYLYPDQPIPEGFNSWSIFIINNPEWVLPQSKEKLKGLYDNFNALGSTIGPSNMAVWFSLPPASPDNSFPDVDVMRGSAFAYSLKLLPSKGPCIITTTDYPGPAYLDDDPDSFKALDNYSILQLHDASPEEIDMIINDLADQLVIGKLSMKNSESEDYWRAWEEAFNTTRNKILDVARNISFKIKTDFFEVDFQSNKKN